MAKTLLPSELVPMDFLSEGEPIHIDLVYASETHPENIFKTAIYHAGARLVLHRDLARIVLQAARRMHSIRGWTLVLKDGLRPVEAQEALMRTEIVKANPRWMEEPGRLLSPPGQGAHPRGMAIDVCASTSDGRAVDMGTAFDEMTPLSARDCTEISAEARENREFLEECFVRAGTRMALPILPLPSEWWDFRIPRDIYASYAPIYDIDLPGPFRMCSAPSRDDAAEATALSLAKAIRLSV